MSGKENDRVVDAARQILENAATLSDLKGVTPSEMEAVYTLGFNFYKIGKYDDAKKIFEFLVLFDHLNAKYWFALGALHQTRKDYAKAVKCYALSSLLDLKNPKAQYQAAECFLALGDRVNAESSLSALFEFAPTDTVIGREYRRKAEELMSGLSGKGVVDEAAKSEVKKSEIEK